MARLFGIDVSGWNAGIDTSRVTADFVIVKSTEGVQGTRYNPGYRDMADGAAGAGKLIGFYHYANGGDPVAEAECFYESIKGYRGRAIACLDWEAQGNPTFESGADVRWCLAFMDRLAQLMGCVPLIYTSKGVCNEYDWGPVASKYPLWGAEYADYETAYGYPDRPWQSSLPWGAWGTDVAIHQFGYVNPRPDNGGISQLDGDILYGDASDWARWCGGGEPVADVASHEVRTVSLADIAATIHYDIMADDANGYSQHPVRWGGDSPEGSKTIEVEGRQYTYQRGSYDCSSSVITAWRLALQGTPYEGALDDATYTGDMREVFLASGLFYAALTPARRGDVYLTDNRHTAMCQDGGSDGVFGYDCLTEMFWNENGGATYGKVGDQTGQEGRFVPYYDLPWATVLHYNGKGDYEADGDRESMTADEGEDEMICFIVPDGDQTVHFYDGHALHALSHPDEMAAIDMVYQQTHGGRSVPTVRLGSREAPYGARFLDAVTREPWFETMNTFSRHKSRERTLRDIVTDAVSTANGGE